MKELDKFRQFLNESETVDRITWEEMNDDDRVNALLTVFEDPNDAEKYVGKKWEDLPDKARDFMRMSESVNEVAIEKSPSGWYLVVEGVWDDWERGWKTVESFITKSPEKYADVVDPDLGENIYEITPVEVK